MNHHPVLELQGVDLCYGGRIAIDQVDLQVDRGEWLALIGPNASGKTTLLRSIAGRLPPTRGFMEVAGEALYPLSARRSLLPGYAVPPEDLPDFLTLRQCLEVHAAAHRLACVPHQTLALFAELGLAAHQDKLNREVSLGTRQKLAVVLALMTAPPLLLLDETFNGLDAASSLALKRHLRDRVAQDGLSIVLATHALDVVTGWCNGAALLDAGRLLRRWDAGALRAMVDAAALEQALAAQLESAQPNRPVM
jgi:ABC-2 type transport system ATP-binding protein